MKKTRFAEEQISCTLREADLGTPVAELVQKMGFGEQTFYRWKKHMRGWEWESYGAQNSWGRRSGS